MTDDDKREICWITMFNAYMLGQGALSDRISRDAAEVADDAVRLYDAHRRVRVES